MNNNIKNQIREISLSLPKISRHWHLASYTPDEVFDILLSAFWNGELETDFERLHFLKVLRQSSDKSGITFHNEDDFNYPKEDNGDIIMLPHPIKLSENQGDWKESEIEKAYSTLASIKFDDYGSLIKPCIYTITVTFEQFSKYCDKKNWQYKCFWCPIISKKKPIACPKIKYIERIKSYKDKKSPSRKDDSKWAKQNGYSVTSVHKLRNNQNITPANWRQKGRRANN